MVEFIGNKAALFKPVTKENVLSADTASPKVPVNEVNSQELSQTTIKKSVEYNPVINYDPEDSKEGKAENSLKGAIPGSFGRGFNDNDLAQNHNIQEVTLDSATLTRLNKSLTDPKEAASKKIKAVLTDEVIAKIIKENSAWEYDENGKLQNISESKISAIIDKMINAHVKDYANLSNEQILNEFAYGCRETVNKYTWEDIENLSHGIRGQWFERGLDTFSISNRCPYSTLTEIKAGLKKEAVVEKQIKELLAQYDNRPDASILNKLAALAESVKGSVQVSSGGGCAQVFLPLLGVIEVFEVKQCPFPKVTTKNKVESNSKTFNYTYQFNYGKPMAKEDALSSIKEILLNHLGATSVAMASPIVAEAISNAKDQIRNELGSNAYNVVTDGYISTITSPKGIDKLLDLYMKKDPKFQDEFDRLANEILGKPDENGQYTPKISVSLGYEYTVYTGYQKGDTFEYGGVIWTLGKYGWSSNPDLDWRITHSIIGYNS